MRDEKKTFETARAVVAAWCAAVNGGRAHEVLKLYSPEATLLSTFSADRIDTPDALEAYFTRLASYPRLHVKLHEETLQDLPLDSRFRVAAGFYSFTFEIDGASRTFESRFTFVIDVSSAAPIMHHHSSRLPTAPA